MEYIRIEDYNVIIYEINIFNYTKNCIKKKEEIFSHVKDFVLFKKALLFKNNDQNR